MRYYAVESFNSTETEEHEIAYPVSFNEVQSLSQAWYFIKIHCLHELRYSGSNILMCVS